MSIITEKLVSYCSINTFYGILYIFSKKTLLFFAKCHIVFFDVYAFS